MSFTEQIIDPLDKFGGRKFLFAVIVTGLAFILTLNGKIAAESFLNFAEIVGGAYIIGNVASKLTTKL